MDGRRKKQFWLIKMKHLLSKKFHFVDQKECLLVGKSRDRFMYLYVVFWEFSKEFYYILYPYFIRPKSFNNLFSLGYKKGTKVATIHGHKTHGE